MFQARHGAAPSAQAPGRSPPSARCQRLHNGVAGKLVRINDCERSARRQLCISTADSWIAAAARWTWSADVRRPNDSKLYVHRYQTAL